MEGGSQMSSKNRSRTPSLKSLQLNDSPSTSSEISPKQTQPSTDNQIWILSEFGKPIFSSCGREDELCSTFALVATLVKRYESWKDSLLSIAASNIYVNFLYKSPLILCLVSRHPYNLSFQLDIIHNQVISILTKSMLKSIYAEKGYNFDLRRWLGGIDKRVEACSMSFNEDPVVFLSGFRILPLQHADRQHIISVMAAEINRCSPDNVVFGIMVAHRQLVAFVRMRKLNLTAPDFNTIVNMIECHNSLKEGETWVPVCLPQFDPNFYLHAYISYLWEGTGPCLLLLSTSKHAFADLSQARRNIEENLCSYKRYAQVRSQLSQPDDISLKQVMCVELWHFMYKNNLTSQICCSSPQKPCIADDELLALYYGYFRIGDLLKRKDKSKDGTNVKNVKMLTVTTECSTIFSWIEVSFELHCTFSPLVTQATAMGAAEKLLKIIRGNENRFFFTLNPGVLSG